MGMAGAESAVGTAENYRRFAEREAAGRSPAYERLAFAVADDELILGFLDGLPRAKRQPNLLFAAARLVLGETPTIESLSELVASRADELATTMRARRTQTNEAARCATLLPALATIPGPVALIEVGASAGLCLQLDRYSYDYGSIRLAGTDPGAPVLRCELCGSTPVPLTMPDVAWRAGLDLNPLDPANPEDREWLRCLVWPGQSERLSRLDAALAMAERHPVTVAQGDLVDDLAALVLQAPRDASVVVFHTAVLAYLEPARRREFARLIDELGVRWLSNEAAEVLPGTTPLRRDDSAFVLALDTEPIALTHPHGDWIEWFS
jgi:hypothetical protein